MIEQVTDAYEQQIKERSFDHIFLDAMSPMEALCYAIYVDLGFSKNTSIEWIEAMTGMRINPKSFPTYIQRARRKHRENRTL